MLKRSGGMKFTLLFLLCYVAVSRSCWPKCAVEVKKKVDSVFHQFDVTNQAWDHEQVRKGGGAHMFWWLYSTTTSDLPLAIYIPGGRHGTASGFANIYTFGPIDESFNERKNSWVNYMNVLFIDSPVGVGFSYVNDEKYLPKNDKEIVDDLIALMDIFFEKHPKFKSTPIHIFGDSYGGKIAMQFTKRFLDQFPECNVKSVTSIAGWISPIDEITSMTTLLFALGLIDPFGKEEIERSQSIAEKFLLAGDYAEAKIRYSDIIKDIRAFTRGVNQYDVSDIIEGISPGRGRVRAQHAEVSKRSYAKAMENDMKILTKFMNEKVKKALKISDKIEWRSSNPTTSINFMEPATDIVKYLVDETNIYVNIVTGNYDLFVSTLGTVKWLLKAFKSMHAGEYINSRTKIIENEIVRGYYNEYKNLTLCTVLNTGHYIAKQNPITMDRIVRDILKKP